MIRIASVSDIEHILVIWLDASIESHNFVDNRFWKSRLGEMRTVYLPAAENYVYDDGIIKGFFSLVENQLAAMFVSPSSQGQGIGRALMSEAFRLRKWLSLTVYEENRRAVAFYEACGFKTVERRIDSETGRTELVMTTSQAVE